jgi:hypothetical protein
VFFRQSDACLVTTNALELACELNPQLHKDLKILTISPPLISTLFFIRPGCASSVHKTMESALLELHSTVAGQQVLTLFQGSHMAVFGYDGFQLKQILPLFRLSQSFSSAFLFPALFRFLCLSAVGYIFC